MKDGGERLGFWIFVVIVVAYFAYTAGREALEWRALWRVGEQRSGQR